MPSFNSISPGMKILHALIDACLHTRDTVFTIREKDNHITLPSTRTVVTTGQSHGSSNHQDRHPGEISSPRPRDAQMCVIIASDTGLSACFLFGVKLLSEPMLDYFNLTLGNESWGKVESRYTNFHARIITWKYPRNGRYNFFSASIC